MSNIGQIDYTIEVADGKYTFVAYCGGGFEIARYGEPWLDRADCVTLQGTNAIAELMDYAHSLETLAAAAVAVAIKDRTVVASAPAPGEVETLLATLESIAAFAPGNGDVCEIIAQRARAALRAYEALHPTPTAPVEIEKTCGSPPDQCCNNPKHCKWG